MKFKKLLTVSLMSLFLGVVSLAAYAKDNTAQLLFVILAKRGSITALNNQPGQYRLTLYHTNPEVIYFTNRPQRVTKQATVNQFLRQWTTGNFTVVPPNAVMTAVRLFDVKKQVQKRTVSYVIILKKPVYNQAKNQLSFQIHALPGNKTPLPKMAHSDYVALFIDKGCISCMYIR